MTWKPILAAGIFCLLSIFPSIGRAQELSRSVSIVPAKTQLTLNPGQTWEGKIEIAVSSPANVMVKPEAVDFKAQSETGGVPLFFRPGADQHVGILSRWIEIGKLDLELEPNMYRSVPVRIRIPRNAPAGGYYGAVLFRIENQTGADQQLGSAIDSAIAALFIVDVSGERSEQGEIAEFYMQRDLNEGLPADALVRFENLGNSHLAPKGVIEIFNEFGWLVDTIEVNPDSALVLPRDLRRFEPSWGKKHPLLATPWFEVPLGQPLSAGMYQARLTLWYGSTGQVVQATDRFFVLPWKALIIFGIASYLLIRLLGFVWYRYKLEVILNRRLSFSSEKKRSVFEPPVTKPVSPPPPTDTRSQIPPH